MASRFRHSGRAALHQQLPDAFDHDLAALVDDLAPEGHDATVGLGGLVLVGHLDAHPQGVADEGGLGEAALDVEQAHQAGLEMRVELHARHQPGHHRQHEQPVGDALAVGRSLGVLGVDVQAVVVGRQAGETDDVGFGDGAGRAVEGVADVQVFEEAGLGAQG